MSRRAVGTKASESTTKEKSSLIRKHGSEMKRCTDPPAFGHIGCGRTQLGLLGSSWTRSQAPSIHAPQLCAIGYFAKITPILFNAFSAAACGVIPSLITSASAAPQTCWEFASA